MLVFSSESVGGVCGPVNIFRNLERVVTGMEFQKRLDSMRKESTQLLRRDSTTRSALGEEGTVLEKEKDF